MTRDPWPLAALATSVGLAPPVLARPQSAATVIVNATIADGTGGPLRRGNVRLEGALITAVGDTQPRAGDTVIDATGLVIAPGFIDIHNHSTEGLATDPAAETQVAQGITTLVVGATGRPRGPPDNFLRRTEAPSS